MRWTDRQEGFGTGVRDWELSPEELTLEGDFLEEQISGDRNSKILDVGCGRGLHCVEMGRRGYDVTGIDPGETDLRQAKKSARQDGVVARFLKKDARVYHGKGTFDLVIMLWDGVFGLAGDDGDNFRILKNAARSLHSGGRLVFTARNGLYRMARHAEDPRADESFDPLTMIERMGEEGHMEVRYYLPTEIRWLMDSLEFDQIRLFGARPGELGSRPLTEEEPVMLAVGVKR